MTDAELKALVAGLAVVQAETSQQIKQTDKAVKELAEQQKETDKQLKETDKAVRELAGQQKETDKAVKELAEQQKKTDRQLNKRIKELGTQIGGLGVKFGSFAEGMAFPAMERILRARFGMEVISTNVKSKQNNENMEIDMLGYTNTTINTAYIVEIKSHLREDGVQQMLKNLVKFPLAFPEHAEKSLYGIIAAVSAPKELKNRVLNQGIYLALVHDEEFKLHQPSKFSPQNFSRA